MEKEARQRLKWVRLYEETSDAGLVCRRCGISRPTLRKWWKRYKKEGLKGLESQSKSPKNSPTMKIDDKLTQLILQLRTDRNLGARRLQNELSRLHDIHLSLATIHKVLFRNKVKPLVTVRKKSDFIRYNRPTPGDRVQMDTCKIGKHLYQYTAIDDCTRYRVLRLYKTRNAKNTIDFIEAVIEEMPFPIQRFQTDRGTEFFATEVQELLLSYGIKFHPNKPASPHLNGKVERSQKTDKVEFYSTIDLTSPDITTLLAEWQHYYNWERPHSAHKGKTPMEQYFQLAENTPLIEDVDKDYDPIKEHIQNQNYKAELKLKKLKQSL